MIDVVELTQKLIRCPSVTPLEAGAMDLLEKTLKPLGFDCYRVPFGKGAQRVDNLFAYRKSGSKHISFAGHTDVVPAGELNDWSHNPFEANIKDHHIYGRGAVDMKGSIASFISAISQIIDSNQLHHSVSLIITGDEEGPAINGTEKLLCWIKDKNLIPDYCLVGEPTSENKIADIIKVGRRGCLNAVICESGMQGHVAYSEKADNPIPRFLKFLSDLNDFKLDDGYKNFQPSNLEITSVDVGNKANNVIYNKISAKLNIRFNPNYTEKSLLKLLNDKAKNHLKDYKISASISGESFYCKNNDFVEKIQTLTNDVTGYIPKATTNGGTSDARFIKDFCPVIEIGLLNKTAHHTDENVSINDLKVLTKIFKNILKNF